MHLKAINKKAKAQVLDEYWYKTAQAKKYIVRKIQSRGGSNGKAEEEKERDLRWPS